MKKLRRFSEVVNGRQLGAAYAFECDCKIVCVCGEEKKRPSWECISDRMQMRRQSIGAWINHSSVHRKWWKVSLLAPESRRVRTFSQHEARLLLYSVRVVTAPSHCSFLLRWQLIKGVFSVSQANARKLFFFFLQNLEPTSTREMAFWKFGNITSAA